MEKVNLNVKGMTCMGCVRSVKNVLDPIPGVGLVDINLESGQVSISFDPGLARPEQFKAAIQDAGYEIIGNS